MSSANVSGGNGDARVDFMTHSIAFNAFEEISDAWHLTDSEKAALLDIDLAGYRDWRKASQDVKLSAEQVNVALCVLDIYDSTHIIFGDIEYANDWVHRPDAALSDRIPLDVMLESSSGVTAIREHLRAIIASYAVKAAE